MTIDQIIKVGALCTAIIGIYAFCQKVGKWMNKGNENEKRINELEEKHNKDIAEQNKELQVLTYSVLALLKAQQGDKSEIPHAVEVLEKHLNEKAHQ